MDIDWAADWMIDYTADILLKHQVKATWFVTHDSPAVRKLQRSELFEIGLHPNFCQGSTQGPNPKETMKFLTTTFPGSRTVRMHRLAQSATLLAMLVNDFGIEVDCSLLLVDTPNIVPHQIYYGKGQKPLLRIPCFWEDDEENYKPNPCWSLSNSKYHCTGLKIFGFHPLFVVLNSLDNRSYETLKNRKPFQELAYSDVEPYIHKGKGIDNFFNELVQYISHEETGGAKVSDLAHIWRQNYAPDETEPVRG